MDNEASGTTVDALSPTPPPPPAAQPHTIDVPMEDILLESSTDAIHAFAESIHQSAAAEGSKDVAFRQEFRRRLLRAMIKSYVWSNARLSYEKEVAEGRLVQEVQDLLSAERDQGRSSPPSILFGRLRARLAEVMAAVSRAAEILF